MPKKDVLNAADVKFCKLYCLHDRSNMECFLEAFPKYRKRASSTNNTALSNYLKLPKIKAELQRQVDEARILARMSLQEKLEYLRQVVLDNEVRMSDKLKAVELSAKLQGMFSDKVQHSGEIKQTHSATPELVEALDKLFK